MDNWRVLTAAEQVAERLRAELSLGAWGGRIPGGSRLAAELGVGSDTVRSPCAFRGAERSRHTGGSKAVWVGDTAGEEFSGW